MSNQNYNRHKLIPPSDDNRKPDKRKLQEENIQKENTEVSSFEPKTKIFIRLISVLVIVVCIAFIARETLFTVSNCLVVGNTNIPTEIVLSSA
ncbi:MAG: hypothetical protein Q4E07_04865 [Eubacteriales bacterium]|nr:hypothetical protein [Eubacteriales bacterium]